MENNITAEEFLKIDNGFDDKDMELLTKSLKTENRMDISDICMTMIEFAKFHCKAQAKIIFEKSKNWKDASNGYSYHSIKEETIINAYDLNNIK
jgi:hypothetical protein